MTGMDSVVVALALHGAVTTTTTVGSFTVPIFLRSVSCGTATAAFYQQYGIASDPRLGTYVCDNTTGTILRYDAAGALIQQMPVVDGNSIWSVHSVALSRDGELYVSDHQKGSIFVFSSAGAFRRELKNGGQPLGLFSPTYLCATPEGTMLISDSENKRILEVEPSGTIIRQIGSIGTAPGLLGGPRGVAMDVAGNVYVADEGNRRVTVYSRTGSYLQTWDIPFQWQLGRTPVIRGIAVDALGRVHVTDTGNSLVHVFESDGTFVGRWGGYGVESQYMLGANGIAFNGHGHIFVSMFRCGMNQYAVDAATVVQRTSWGDVKARYR